MCAHGDRWRGPCTRMCTRRVLTLYMWANSISKGVSRERGGGFTVTEMTLEFRTVVFLGDSRQAMLGSGAPRPISLGLASQVPTRQAQPPQAPTPPLGLALGSPIFPSGFKGKLGVALESLQG